jgi:uncharacterized membrane protein YbhN (UPF0104 family)
VGLLLWVAPLGDVLASLAEIDPLWLIAAVGLELVSCASYVLVFRRLFERVSRRSPGKLAWLGLGAGAVLPGGDVAGVAASCMLLHRDGAPKRWLVVRAGALLLLILAYSIGYLTSVVPVPAGVGVLDGGLGAALIIYGVPAAAAVAAVLVYHALAVWLPALGGLAASLRLRREPTAALMELRPT